MPVLIGRWAPVEVTDAEGVVSETKTLPAVVIRQEDIERRYRAVVRRRAHSGNSVEVLHQQIEMRQRVRHQSHGTEMRVPDAPGALIALVVEHAHSQRCDLRFILHGHPAVERGPVIALDEDIRAVRAPGEGEIAVDASQGIPQHPAPQREQPPDLIPAVTGSDERIQAQPRVRRRPPLSLEASQADVLPEPTVQRGGGDAEFRRPRRTAVFQ